MLYIAEQENSKLSSLGVEGGSAFAIKRHAGSSSKQMVKVGTPLMRCGDDLRLGVPKLSRPAVIAARTCGHALLDQCRTLAAQVRRETIARPPVALLGTDFTG
jgi:hypothetical protein